MLFKRFIIIIFIFGISTSLLLINYGNKENNKINKAIGLFYIFISLMQFVEYLIWKDINCTSGYNNLASYIGLLLLYLQPLILLLLCRKYLDSKNIIHNKIILIINIIFIFYVLYCYNNYIKNENNLCITTNEENHLVWKWKTNEFKL